MKEFIEKLIGRLEEEKQACHINAEYYTEKKVGKIIDIVNQLAEEYAKDINVSTIDAGELFGNGWIPCSGCEDCQHKECEHHGKV
jgi:hypothetical protein